jgi:Glycosyltransferases involved in cell wall biogenesis
MLNPPVVILMATFNGAPHLREQLDSLIRQTYSAWRLIVHDDGSTDGTLAILDEYRRIDPRITVMDDGVVGLGAAGNFLHLMRHVKGAYYLFCDQDDIWLEEKIAQLVAVISNCEGPAVVYANSYLYVDGVVIPQMSTLLHPTSLRDTLFFNSGIQGCAIIFNHSLMDRLAPFPEFVAMHDHLVTMGAVTFGQMIYLNQPLVLYRQHKQNATGNQPLGFFRRSVSFLFGGKPVVNRNHYNANLAFFQHYQSMLDQSSQKLFKAYFRYVNSRSVFERLFILLRNRFTLGNKRGLLLYKTLVRRPIN